MKFALGGDQGPDVLADGYPESRQVTCATGAPTDADLESTESRPGLKYDSTTDQYVCASSSSKTAPSTA